MTNTRALTSPENNSASDDNAESNNYSHIRKQPFVTRLRVDVCVVLLGGGVVVALNVIDIYVDMSGWHDDLPGRVLMIVIIMFLFFSFSCFQVYQRLFLKETSRFTNANKGAS